MQRFGERYYPIVLEPNQSLNRCVFGHMTAEPLRQFNILMPCINHYFQSMLRLETIKVHINIDPRCKCKPERGGAGRSVPTERCFQPCGVVQRCGLREYG
jgi:hypothetical protein